jgi:hypothetical protein
VGNLMRSLECLLHEYLSFNWDHADAMLRCNQSALQCAVLACSASLCLRLLSHTGNPHDHRPLQCSGSACSMPT